MQELLAHGGHEHAPALGPLALLVAMAVTAALLIGTAVFRRYRSPAPAPERPGGRRPAAR